MENRLTPSEAWQDFYDWVRKQPFWLELSKKERKRIYDAQADYTGKRGQNLGDKRIRDLLKEYAPNEYSFHESAPYFTKP